MIGVANANKFGYGFYADIMVDGDFINSWPRAKFLKDIPRFHKIKD